MSFGAGMGAGTAAGIGSGMATGKKQASDQIRDYLLAHDLKVVDSAGHEIPVEIFLKEAVGELQEASPRRVAVLLTVSLLVGVTVCVAVAYLTLF